MYEAGRIPVSAVLITRDAERHLDAVLAAVACCAEIVVVDSGSTDRTLEIARAHGARTAHQDWLGYGPQKRLAVERARYDWVLCLDADEVLDATAVAALRAIDWSALPSERVWRLRRINCIGGLPVRHGAWNPDLPVRLFNRTVHRFDANPVHESVPVRGPSAILPGVCWHYSYRDLADVFRLDYHRRKAADYAAGGRRAGTPVLLLRAAGGFLRSYLLKLGFLDGTVGLIVALSVALNACLGLALASVGQAGEAGEAGEDGTGSVGDG